MDTSHFPRCDFSNFEHLPLTLLLEVFSGQLMNSVSPVLPRALKHDFDLISGLAPKFSDRHVCLGIRDWCAYFRGRALKEEKEEDARCKQSSHDCPWDLVALFYIVRFHLDQWLVCWYFAGEAECAPLLRKKMSRLAWRLMGSWRGVTQLLPGAWYRWMGPKHDVPEATRSQNWSRDLLERAFDDSNICVEMMKLLVLFSLTLRFFYHNLTSRSIHQRSRCRCHPCYWASEGVLLPLRVPGRNCPVVGSIHD